MAARAHEDWIRRGWFSHDVTKALTRALTLGITRERLIAHATILMLVELSLFAFCVAGAHGLIVPLEHPGSTDFVSFHAAGALANAGTPWLAYDRVAHHAAERAALGFDAAYNYFYYPPIFLLICAPLARLPYLTGFLVFQTVTGVLCFLAARLIRRDLPLVVFLAFPGLWWAIGTGQNALLTAALFAAGLAWVDRRPWLAGMCLGALCYKPHFGLLIPVALIAGGHGRAFAGAAASAIGLTLASAALFGIGTWEAFLAAAQGTGEVYAGHAIFMGGLTSPFGALMALGAPRGLAFAAQAVAMVLAAAAVALVWRRGGGLPLRAAMLLAATPIAVPVLMFYDLMLVFLALVWLSHVWLSHARSGARPSRAAAAWTVAMGLVFLGPLLSGNLSTETHWLFAALTATLAFGLTVTMAAREPVGQGAALEPVGEGAVPAPVGEGAVPARAVTHPA